MKIQVLGSGCPSCKSLYELTKKAVEELGIKEDVEYINDISKIIKLGVISSPVLAIDGKAVMTGATNNIEKIKYYIQNNGLDSKENCCDDPSCDYNKSDCNCGSGCC